MSRILIDARCLTRQRTGVGRYTESLMIAMRELEEAQKYNFFSYQDPDFDKEIAPFSPRMSKRKIGNVPDYFLSHQDLNSVFHNTNVDLFHSLFHIIPRSLEKEIPKIITLHDTIWIDHAEVSQPTRFKAMTIRAFGKLAIPDSLRRADHVICVSEATAERAKEWISRDKMTVIGHGVDRDFFDIQPEDENVKLYTKNKSSYICAIANDKPYKNLKILIDSFDALDDENLNLVLVGSCEGLREYVQQCKTHERIFLAGMLDDASLKIVLHHAALFVFPSLVEGFGLPVLEAMAAGVPTVVSDLDPMRSVANGASLLFDPKNVRDLSAKIKEALVPLRNKELRKKGSEHAKKQTWENTAKKTISVYQKVLANKHKKNGGGKKITA